MIVEAAAWVALAAWKHAVAHFFIEASKSPEQREKEKKEREERKRKKS